MFVLGALLAAAPSIEVHRETWDTSDGLPQSSVTAVAQDPEGFLVLGTFAGLAQFDGRTFERVGEVADQTWSGVRVTAIAVADGGDAWVGTQDGRLLQLRDGELSQHSAPDMFANNAIWSISVDGDDTWFAGPRGAARWDENVWTVVEREEGVNVVVARDGVVWIASQTGLERREGSRTEHIDTHVGEPLSLCATEAGVVVGGEGGVETVTADAVVALDGAAATQLICAADGSVWAAAEQTLRRVGSQDAFTFSHAVRSLFEDREHNLWVGTDGGGLTRVIRADWTVSKTPNGALPILQLPDDSLLFGGFCGGGGLFRLHGDQRLETLSPKCVRALASDEHGVLVGQDSEVLRWSEEDGLQSLFDVGHHVLVLRPTPGVLWIGTDSGGAFAVRGTSVEPVDVGDARVLSILPTDDGTWFGTHRGLTKIDGAGRTRWTVNDGLPRGPVRGLLESADGTLFIATYGGGLGVLRDGAFRRLTAADGLGDNALSAVVDDGRGALWINGNRGVTRLRKDDLEGWLTDERSSPRMRRWDTPEGNGGGQPAGAVLRDGTVVFPTAAGVLHLSPEQVFQNPVQPRVVVESADVDGVALVQGKTIQVPPGPGRVFVDFTAATLRHPELATLQVRLSNVDEPGESVWEISADGVALWGGLHPGTYTIEFRATNEDQVQSEPLLLRFELEPYWHQRVSVWAACAVFMLAGGLAVHQLRIHAVAERNRALQREVRQRIAAEEEQRRVEKRLSVAERMEAVGRLAGGIAHDFNNLLTAVAGTSAALRGMHEEGGMAERGAPLVDNLEGCVERGASLTRSLLAFARKQPMEPSRTHVDALVGRLVPMLESSLRDDIELRFTPDAAPVGTVVDPAMLELALLNLTLNAQDALARGGKVEVGLTRVTAEGLARRLPGLIPEATGEWVIITVWDDGEGMSTEQLAKAREPFFTTRTHGNGLGLPSVEGFAAQSGGALHLASAPQRGTTVSLVLPFSEPPEAAPVAQGQEPSSKRTTGARVLICDDDELVRDSLVRVFERAGYETLSFGDPWELLKSIDERSAFDILLTDVLMPGMTGDALARRLEELRPGLPVVFMSGYTDDIRTDALGGRLLHKPFRSAEVVRVVEETLAAKILCSKHVC